MNHAVRRRLALGGAVTAGALVAGLLIAPASSAAVEGVRVTLSAARNDAAASLTLTSTDADQRYGALATFTRNDGPATFTVDIAAQAPVAKDTTGTAEVDLTDLGDGVGADGPADAGTYRVSIDGEPAPLILPGGGGNDTCASCFSVLPSAPLSVTSVAPTSLRPAQSVDVSVLGTGFTRGSTIEFVNGGAVDTTIRASAAPSVDPVDDVTTPTQLRRRLVVDAGSSPGVRNVRVRQLDGTTVAVCTACFTVAGPDLTAVTPAGGDNTPTATRQALTVTGSNITDGALSLEFLGAPGNGAPSRSALAVPTTRTSYSTTSLSATANLSDAAPGVYQPVVRGANGVVNACTCRFTVLQDRPLTFTSLDREGSATGSTQAPGTTAVYDIVGAGFSRGAGVTVSGTGVTTTSVEFVSTALLRATLQTTAAAAAGARDVTVALTDGKTATRAGSFTVGAAPTPSPSPSATPTVTGRYVGLASPLRVLDTRASSGPRRTGLITLDLSSRITDTNATAAVLNVTVTNGTRRGFLVAYPDGTTKPGTSNVNFEGERRATSTTPASAGTQANEVVVRLPANRRVSLFVDSASAHVIADLVGSFTSADTGGRITTQAPVRALDTRDTATPTRRGEVVLDLSSRLPATATAAILNVTVTRTAGRGFVTVYPTGTTRPGTSNVNFERGQTQANEVTTQVGTGSNAGRVSLFVDSANASVIVDVVGAVTAQQATGTQVFTALASPQRAIDTRLGNGARRSGNVTVQMPASVPANATGVVLNVTATNGTRAGFVTVFPAGQSNPGTSNVNFPTNLTQANEVVSALGTDRSVIAFVGGAGGPAAHVIVDVVGYLTPQSAAAASPSPSASSGAGLPGLPGLGLLPIPGLGQLPVPGLG